MSIRSLLSTNRAAEPAAGRRLSDLRPWAWALLAGLVAASALVTHEAWLDILRIVRKDPEASHIILVMPVFVWLWWTYRDRLAGCPVRAPQTGAAVVAAGWALSAYGYINGHLVFWHLGAVVTAVGCVVSIIGVEAVRRMWPAFVVLLFLLPVPGIIRRPIALELQNVSARLTEQGMILFGQAVERSGNRLLYNGAEIDIVEACNGMRMITMLFLVCYTFVFVHRFRAWARVFLLLLAPLLAIVCNIFRLVPTVYAHGHATEATAGQVHDILGWVMIGVAYVLLMGIVALLRWLMLPVDSPADGEAAPDAAAPAVAGSHA